MFAWFQRRRRRGILSHPFPESSKEFIRKNIPLWEKLPSQLQKDGLQKVQIFLAEKEFEGCGGLELTEEIRVTIAAQACLLLVGRNIDIYPKLRTVLVYPSSYVDGRANEEESTVRLGESWDRGVVVLAWHSVLCGGLNPQDGRNVVLHEFAHQLDQEYGPADGLPRLEQEGDGVKCRHGRYTAWAAVLGSEYEKLVKRADRGKKTWLDAYGATHPAEFFAVATETFFEKPRPMKRRHPELYEELRSYFGVDPAEWELDEPPIPSPFKAGV